MSIRERIHKEQNELAFQALCRRIAANDDTSVECRTVDLTVFHRHGTKSQVRQLATILRHNTVLENFVISPSLCDEDTADALAYFLQHNPSLHDVDLIDCIGDGMSPLSVVRRLLVGLSQNTSLPHNRLVDVFLDCQIDTRQRRRDSSSGDSHGTTSTSWNTTTTTTTTSVDGTSRDIITTTNTNTTSNKNDWKQITQCVKNMRVGKVWIVNGNLGIVYTIVKGLIDNPHVRQLILTGCKGYDWVFETKCCAALIKHLCTLVHTSSTLERVKFDRVVPGICNDTFIAKVAVAAATNPTACVRVVTLGLDGGHNTLFRTKLFRQESFYEIPYECDVSDINFRGVVFQHYHTRQTTILTVHNTQLSSHEVIHEFVRHVFRHDETFSSNNGRHYLHIDFQDHCILKNTVTPLLEILRCQPTWKHFTLTTERRPRTNVVAAIAQLVPYKTTLQSLHFHGRYILDRKTIDALVQMCRQSTTLQNLHLRLHNCIEEDNLDYLCQRLPDLCRLKHLEFDWYYDRLLTLPQKFIQAIRSSPHLTNVVLQRPWCGRELVKQVNAAVLENRISTLVHESSGGTRGYWSPFLAKCTRSETFVALHAMIHYLPPPTSWNKRMATAMDKDDSF
jgi:hypothetical protein